MTVNVPLDRGPEFVDWLAQHLTDLEFELLLRKRITVQYERAKEHRPEIYDGVTYIYYRHSINDQSKWEVTIGKNYDTRAQSEGEVLSITMSQVIQMLDLRDSNKMSLLLPPPVEQETADEF